MLGVSLAHSAVRRSQIEVLPRRIAAPDFYGGAYEEPTKPFYGPDAPTEAQLRRSAKMAPNSPDETATGLGGPLPSSDRFYENRGSELNKIRQMNEANDRRVGRLAKISAADRLAGRTRRTPARRLFRCRNRATSPRRKSQRIQRTSTRASCCSTMRSRADQAPPRCCGTPARRRSSFQRADTHHQRANQHRLSAGGVSLQDRSADDRASAAISSTGPAKRLRR